MLKNFIEKFQFWRQMLVPDSCNAYQLAVFSKIGSNELCWDKKQMLLFLYISRLEEYNETLIFCTSWYQFWKNLPTKKKLCRKSFHLVEISWTFNTVILCHYPLPCALTTKICCTSSENESRASRWPARASHHVANKGFVFRRFEALKN